jgi:hypothetical protein
MSVFNQLLTRPLDIIQTQYNLIVCNEKKITSNVTKDQVPDFRKQRLSKKKIRKGISGQITENLRLYILC